MVFSEERRVLRTHCSGLIMPKAASLLPWAAQHSQCMRMRRSNARILQQTKLEEQPKEAPSLALAELWHCNPPKPTLLHPASWTMCVELHTKLAPEAQTRLKPVCSFGTGWPAMEPTACTHSYVRWQQKYSGEFRSNAYERTQPHAYAGRCRSGFGNSPFLRR